MRKSAGGRGGGNDKREREELVVALAAEVARDVALRETGAGRSGSVLVFLPGWDEIKEITKTLQVSICIKSRLPVCPYTKLTTFRSQSQGAARARTPCDEDHPSAQPGAPGGTTNCFRPVSPWDGEDHPGDEHRGEQRYDRRRQQRVAHAKPVGEHLRWPDHDLWRMGSDACCGERVWEALRFLFALGTERDRDAGCAADDREQ